jgi:pimeloyl-ACP methyl ester carboxylesterase
MTPVAAFDGVRLAYERSVGSGDPVAIVPGAWGDHRGWGRTARGLAGVGLDVLVYDRRGRGESAGPSKVRAVREDASDLARLLEGVDLRPVHLLAGGTSAGIALRLAFDRPELVRSVILHDPPFLDLLGSPSEEAALRGAYRALAETGPSDPTRAARAYLSLTDADARAWDDLAPSDQEEATLNATRWGPDLTDPETFRADREALPLLGTPVLVTTGEHSAPFFARGVEELTRHVPVITAITIPEAGDLPQLTEGDRYVGVLTTFLLERNVPST